MKNKVFIILLGLLLFGGNTITFGYWTSNYGSDSENEFADVTIGNWRIGISTPQEFYDFATKTDSVKEDYYYLLNDIDFSGFTWELDAINNNAKFKGHFDGDNHTLSNLTIYTDSSTYRYLGIFAIISGGTVENLKLDNVETDIDDGALGSKTYRSGLIAGEVNGTSVIKNITINNCGVRANKGAGAGGIVGYIRGTTSNVTISNIKATNLKVFNANFNAGGIVGQINKDVPSVVITDIDIEGDIFSFANSSHVGGIVGKIENNSGLIIQRAIIDITTQNTLETSQNYLKYGKKYIGGIIGYSSTTSALLDISDTFVTGRLLTNGAARSKYVGVAIARNLGTYTITNSFYSNVQFRHTDGNLYYTQ
ncbi:MAG: hypothetical protein KAH05_05535, partial [Clostridiales bacterium]|nr:hypothetical protein [Clostridiales bacterium]